MNIKKYAFIYLLISLLFFSFSKKIYCTSKDNISELSLPEGFKISIFCYGLVNPWMMTFDKEDNLLVTIPERGVVVALPDKDNNGKADRVINILYNLKYPTGIEMFNNKLYIATTKTIIVGSFDSNNLEMEKDAEMIEVNDFPFDKDAPLFRTIKFGIDSKMYVSIGAPCNVCIPKNNMLGSILQMDDKIEHAKIFASGLRYSIGLTFNKETRQLWATDITRDGLKTYPHDEINRIEPQKFYGWPYCYGNNISDPALNSPQLCNNAIKPEIILPENSSPYGLVFYFNELFPKDYYGDLFVALYGKEGSNNGFKVIRVLFKNNKPIKTKDFITGWITKDGKILGRPVDIAINKKGEMFITDAYNGIIYKVTYNKGI